MPGRLTPLITNQVYHVFNRGIDRRTTFTSGTEYSRAVETLLFYKFASPLLRFSIFSKLDAEKTIAFLEDLDKSEKAVEIICYCLMPNHFHFLLKQLIDGGISKFLGNFQNSYTKYFNTKHKRDGSLFLDQFKAVRIEIDEQLLHVSRYIHLNPYTGYVVKSLEGLEIYPWSSLESYLSEAADDGIEKDIILDFFKNKEDYKKFVFDQADYQREIKKIEHLTLE